jgi:tetratricopeptide (TPR) repeat protein
MQRVVHGVGLFIALLLLGCSQAPPSRLDPEAAKKKLQDEAEAAKKEVQDGQHKRLVQMGKEAMRRQHFDEAEAAFAKAMEIKPDDETGRVLLQEAKDAKQKQIDAKEASYQKAMSDGRAALQNKGYQHAVDAFAEALRLKDGDEQATALYKKAEFLLLVQRGHEAVEGKRYAEAVEALTTASKKLPDDQECRQALRQEVEACRKPAIAAGRSALEAKKYEEASKLLTGVLRLAPDDKEATALWKEAEFHVLMERGRKALDAKRYGEAVTALEAATRLKPDDATVRDLLRQARPETLKAALKARREVAQKEFDLRRQAVVEFDRKSIERREPGPFSNPGSTGSVGAPPDTCRDEEMLYNWALRLLKADLELSDQPADRVKAYESHLLRMKELEEFYMSKKKQGWIREADVATAEYYRLDAEVMLERAKAP